MTSHRIKWHLNRQLLAFPARVDVRELVMPLDIYQLDSGDLATISRARMV